jgi:ribonuclease HII
LSIAAASVIAKVYRDRLLCELDERFPGYGLRRNKGYGTAEHLRALERLGPTEMHRRSFRPVAMCGPLGLSGIAQPELENEMLPLEFAEE